MVKCDKCPCLYYFDGCYYCSTKDEFISFDYEQTITEYCPLKRIELKDGTTYEPEIVGD